MPPIPPGHKDRIQAEIARVEREEPKQRTAEIVTCQVCGAPVTCHYHGGFKRVASNHRANGVLCRGRGRLCVEDRR